MKYWLMFMVLYYTGAAGWALVPKGNPLCLWDMSTMVQVSVFAIVPLCITGLWAACATGCGRIFGDVLECIFDIFN